MPERSACAVHSMRRHCRWAGRYTSYPWGFAPGIATVADEWRSYFFDAVIDFEKAMRDPADPDRLLPAYDSGDHLHPNDAGCKAMAEALDLSLFARDK